MSDPVHSSSASPDPPKSPGAVERAVDALRTGRIVVVTNDDDPATEGELCMAATQATAESINFMLRRARGLVCLALTEERLRKLGLDMMTAEGESTERLPMAVSIEASEGVTTGISASDRATTVRAAVAEGARPEHLRSPGHVFPVRVRSGGVLRQPGRVEAAVDLVRLAGLPPAAVTCQVLREDGAMAVLDDLTALCDDAGLVRVSVADLVRYRLQHETLVRRAGDAHLPTRNAGSFRAIVYENEIDGIDHIALVKGDVAAGEPVLVRLHSECLTGDAFHSLRCDCGEQLDRAMEQIDREGRGVILYLRQEGRGIGLKNKIRAYGLQDREGLDTVEANVQLGFAADQRDYGVGGQMLVELGVRRLRLLTNNPRKQSAIEALGLEIVERVPLEVAPNDKNREYLRTKREKLGHALRFGEED